MTTKGLGRGLSALFSDTEEAYENAQGESASGVRELPLSDIYPNPDQSIPTPISRVRSSTKAL